MISPIQSAFLSAQRNWMRLGEVWFLSLDGRLYL
jgi:hypothetical protein